MHKEQKKTVIVGATPNPARYAYAAAKMLNADGYEFIPLGIRKGEVLGKEILNLKALPSIENVDTLTLYINAQHQNEWSNYLLGLHPQRIIFNPGAENPELANKAKEQKIECVNACTLVMLSTGQF